MDLPSVVFHHILIFYLHRGGTQRTISTYTPPTIITRSGRNWGARHRALLVSPWRTLKASAVFVETRIPRPLRPRPPPRRLLPKVCPREMSFFSTTGSCLQNPSSHWAPTTSSLAQLTAKSFHPPRRQTQTIPRLYTRLQAPRVALALARPAPLHLQVQTLILGMLKRHVCQSEYLRTFPRGQRLSGHAHVARLSFPRSRTTNQVYAFSLDNSAEDTSIVDIVTSKNSPVGASDVEHRQTRKYLYILTGSTVYSIPITISHHTQGADNVTAQTPEDEQNTEVVVVPTRSQSINPFSIFNNVVDISEFLRHESLQAMLDPFGTHDPKAYGILSTFNREYTEILALKSGQRGTDSRSWTVGFDVRIFARSVRKFPSSKPIHCPYKLRGTHHEYEAYVRSGAHWTRRHTSADVINSFLSPVSHESPVAPELERIADAFFNGREVPEDIEVECTTKSKQTKAYNIEYKVGEHTKTLNSNLAKDKKLIFFLQDCAMANHLELVYQQKGTAPMGLTGTDGSIKVYRDDKHKKYSKLVEMDEDQDIVAGNPAESGYAVIAVLHPNIELRDPLGLPNVDTTTNSQDPSSSLTDEELKQLAASVAQPPTQSRKPKKKKVGKKSKQLNRKILQSSDLSTEVHSPNQEDKPLADTVMAETLLNSKKATSEVKSAPKQIDKSVQLGSVKLFPNGMSGASKPKDGNGDIGWKTVEPRIPNKPRGSTPQFNHRSTNSSPYSPRTSSLQANHGSPSRQANSAQQIPRVASAQFYHHGQKAVASGGRINTAGGSMSPNRVAAPPKTAQIPQSVSASRNTQIVLDQVSPTKTRLPVLDKVNSSDKEAPHPRDKVESRAPEPGTRIFDPSEYPAMPSRPKSSSVKAPATNSITAFEAGQDTEKEPLKDTTEIIDRVTSNLGRETTPSIDSDKSFEAKPASEFVGGTDDKSGLVADSPTISESETDETPDYSSQSVSGVSEKTADAFQGTSSTSQVNAPFSGTSVSSETVDQPEDPSPIIENDETNDVAGNSIDEEQNTRHQSSEVLPSDSGVSARITSNIQVLEQDSLSSDYNGGDVEQEESLGNGLTAADDDDDDALSFKENANQSLNMDTSNLMNLPPISSAPTFNNNVLPSYNFHQHPGWVPLQHPPPAPFYHPIGGAPVGYGHPYVGPIPPGPPPFQPYNPVPHFHPSQQALYTNHLHRDAAENSQHMTVEPATRQDSTIRSHPTEAQSASPTPSIIESADVGTNSSKVAVKVAIEPQPAIYNAFRCSYCQDSGTPKDVQSLVFCPGCGPTCNIRYCSTACLLADAYDHSTCCMNFPASQRLAFHDLPEQFIYEKDPIMPLNGLPPSPEQFRQKAYMMYCNSGPFPTTLKAWAKRNSAEASLQGVDLLEQQKRTGEYHVFRSALTTVGTRRNPGADVIFTIILRKGDPAKKILSRCLNASFLLYRREVVEFLFLFIRHFILDAELFEMAPHHATNTVVLEEFKHQFTREFNFDITPYEDDLKMFSIDEESRRIQPLLDDIESKYPILQRWWRC
ncbi:hypothetical protein HYFRA_00007319 [Hymenoscyphus fraxineus]|uniref:Uncharacterized protein n=1 Tax=Hymenoscyphus fraxineus TaxID=746836 RepID=A0A9N9KP99_9HELO|nr:hypothetical protein HYFRA_00007319 [Hymenoscyphus fraxineus]